MTYIDKDKAMNLDFRINVNLFESRRKTAERAVQAYANAISEIPAADVVPMQWVREHMSGDYISREQAVENAIDQMRHSKSETAMRERLLNMVAADVRPVVTCGECKHWFENGSDYCSCDRDALLRERDFFCAAGEKREES